MADPTDPMKTERDKVIKRVLGDRERQAGPAKGPGRFPAGAARVREEPAPELPGMDLSLSPPLEGEDPGWDKIKGNLRPQDFVGSGKFDDVVRRAWDTYLKTKQDWEAVKRGGTPTVKIRGKF